uniref:LIM zinc-binding domain-containing protein n=1 Tax=Mesocestoides corti TaxID=53468 RepID=A0A5K3F7J0_MESCO
MDNSPWSCACPPSPSHAFRTLPSSRYALSVCFDAKFRILISQAKTHFFSGKESASAKTENNIDEKKEGRKESEALKAAKEVTKVSQNVADAASVAGATGFRASDIRNRFEKGESFDQEKSKETKKRKTKLKYAGVGSMKDKLLQEANKQVNGSKDPTKLKEITPPREGVAVGVLESQPQARPEGVEGPTTGDATVTDYIGIGKKTKDVRERFRQLEKTGGVIEEEEGEKRTIDPEEFRQATTEATRSAKARWKDIESGKVETRIEKTKVDLGSGTHGGVYENEPDSLLGIARGEEKEDAPHLVVTTSAAERKNAFLKKASEEGKIKRLDPKAELQELASREKNTVFESTPAARPEDVVAAGSTVDDFLNLSGAKSIREKFQDPSKLQHEVKKTTIELRGEGGVYENEPEQRDDVVRGGDLDEAPSPGDVKWASAAKERFMKDAEERSKAVRSQKVVLVEGAVGPTVYESQPTNSAADAKADQEEDEHLVGAFATSARQRFLEKQREAEEASKKSTPGMIDIWSEMPKESGVFENVPAAHQEGVVVSGMYSDDEEDEEEEE